MLPTELHLMSLISVLVGVRALLCQPAECSAYCQNDWQPACKSCNFLQYPWEGTDQSFNVSLNPRRLSTSWHVKSWSRLIYHRDSLNEVFNTLLTHTEPSAIACLWRYRTKKQVSTMFRPTDTKKNQGN